MLDQPQENQPDFEPHDIRLPAKRFKYQGRRYPVLEDSQEHLYFDGVAANHFLVFQVPPHLHLFKARRCCNFLHHLA